MTCGKCLLCFEMTFTTLRTLRHQDISAPICVWTVGHWCRTVELEPVQFLVLDPAGLKLHQTGLGSFFGQAPVRARHFLTNYVCDREGIATVSQIAQRRAYVHRP